MADIKNLLSKALSVCCILIAILYIVAAVIAFVNSISSHITGLVLSIYLVIIGVMLILFDFKSGFPGSQYFTFLSTFLGRGVFYTFLGAILQPGAGVNTFFDFVGIFMFAVGAIFIVLAILAKCGVGKTVLPDSLTPILPGGAGPAVGNAA